METEQIPIEKSVTLRILQTSNGYVIVNEADGQATVQFYWYDIGDHLRGVLAPHFGEDK